MQESQHLCTSKEVARLGWDQKFSACGKAALIFNARWRGSIREFITEYARFVVGVFGSARSSLIVASVYLPDSSVSGALEMYRGTLEKLTEIISDLQRRHRGGVVCVCIDANVELPREREGTYREEEYMMTGRGVQGRMEEIMEGPRLAMSTRAKEEERTKEQMRIHLLGFMQIFGLLASNTFGVRDATWESYSRRSPVRRVLDYVLVPRDWAVVQSKVD